MVVVQTCSKPELFPETSGKNGFCRRQARGAKVHPFAPLSVAAKFVESKEWGNDGTLTRAASAVTVPSGTLHITNLHVDSEFVIVAEINDVVAAVAGASGTTQALSMDRKQKRRPANRHVRIIDR